MYWLKNKPQGKCIATSRAGIPLLSLASKRTKKKSADSFTFTKIWFQLYESICFWACYFALDGKQGFQCRRRRRSRSRRLVIDILKNLPVNLQGRGLKIPAAPVYSSQQWCPPVIVKFKHLPSLFADQAVETLLRLSETQHTKPS